MRYKVNFWALCIIAGLFAFAFCISVAQAESPLLCNDTAFVCTPTKARVQTVSIINNEVREVAVLVVQDRYKRQVIVELTQPEVIKLRAALDASIHGNGRLK